eukprot:Nk52_evm28s1737 gene=Nk52_evmTU28s1737
MILSQVLTTSTAIVGLVFAYWTTGPEGYHAGIGNNCDFHYPSEIKPSALPYGYDFDKCDPVPTWYMINSTQKLLITLIMISIYFGGMGIVLDALKMAGFGQKLGQISGFFSLLEFILLGVVLIIYPSQDPYSYDYGSTFQVGWTMYVVIAGCFIALFDCLFTYALAVKKDKEQVCEKTKENRSTKLYEEL